MPPRLDPTMEDAAGALSADDVAGPAPADVDAAPEEVMVSLPAPAPAPESVLSPEVERARVLSLIKKCVADLKSVCDRALEIVTSLRSSTMSPAERREKSGELKDQIDDFIAMKKLTRTFRGIMSQYIDAVVSGNTVVRAEMRKVISTAAAIRTSTEADNDFNRPMREFFGASASLQKGLDEEYRAKVVAAEGQLFTMLDSMAKGLDEVSGILNNDVKMGMPAAALTAELVRASGLTGDAGIMLEETQEIQQRRYLRKIKNSFGLFADKMEAASKEVDADLGPGLWMQQSKKPCCGKLVLSATEVGLSAGVGELVHALKDIKAAYLSATGVNDKHIVALHKACQKFYQLPLEKILGVAEGQAEADTIVACRAKLDKLLFAETLPETCEALVTHAPQGWVLTSTLNGEEGGGGTGIFQVFAAARVWKTQADQWLATVADLLPQVRTAYNSFPQNSEENKVLSKNYNLLFGRSMNVKLHAAAYGLLPPADANQVVADTACLRDEAVRAIVTKYVAMDASQLNALKFDEVFQGVSAELRSKLQEISGNHVILLQLVPLAARALDTTERMRRSGLEFDTVTSHYGNIQNSLDSYAARIQQAAGNVAAVLKNGWGNKAKLMPLQEPLRDALTVISACTEVLELFCQDLKVWRGLSNDAAPVKVINEITAALAEQHAVIKGLLTQFRDNCEKMPEKKDGDEVSRLIGANSEVASIKANTALIGELRDTIQASLLVASSGADGVLSWGRMGVVAPAADGPRV